MLYHVIWAGGDLYRVPRVPHAPALFFCICFILKKSRLLVLVVANKPLKPQKKQKTNKYIYIYIYSWC